MMTVLEEKQIDAYTVLVMAKEKTLEDVPDTVISTGNTLRYEVKLEEARRTIGIVPDPVDYDVLGRIEELEQTVDIILGGDVVG